MKETDVELELSYLELPAHLRDGIRRYVEEGCPTGGFLEGVISNDLVRAVTNADPESRAHLLNIIHWFTGYAPSDCWGSPEAYRAWIDKHKKVPGSGRA